MKTILNVAEKPSVAKQITKTLSNFQFKNTQTLSKYNPVHIFEYQLPSQNEQLQKLIQNIQQPQNMIFTSVTGHTFSYKFVNNNWLDIDPIDLFKKQEIVKFPEEDKKDIIKNLQVQAKLSDILILWLDCDLEGENIAFEVIDIVKQQNPDIQIFRAHFSSLERSQIIKALQNLRKPDENMNNAVDARQELDLRIGSAFTRFQTMLLQNKLQNNQLISYGLCQFPTLGFIIDRFFEYSKFEKEDFWKIKCGIQQQLNDNKDNLISFDQKREVFKSQEEAKKIFQKSKKGKKKLEAIIKNVEIKETIKYKPLPLNTLQFQQIGTQFLKISSASLMEKAEKLYQKGYISYPRTETNQFPSSINDNILQILIKKQTNNENWGDYAQKLVKNQENNNEDTQYLYPRKGNLNDNAHPPIYPIRGVQSKQNLIDEGLDYNVYELITRHFLAVCSQNAQIKEINIDIKVNGIEDFQGKFKEIKEKGYLQVYDKFENIQTQNIPQELLKTGYKFTPDTYKLEKGQTQPQPLLTERDLLTLMDKHKIGTDATMHDHIKRIQEREYVYKKGQVFIPNTLGISLVETYKKMGFNLHDAQFRSIMEQRIQNIVNNKEQKEIVVNEILEEMQNTFKQISVRKEEFYDIASSYLDYNKENNKNNKKNQNNNNINKYGKCGKCQKGNLQLIQQSKSDMIDNYFESKGKKKYLKCDSCQTLIDVPQQGEISLYKKGVNCEYCNFPVFSNTKKSKLHSKIEYKFCPVCFYNPPTQFKKQENKDFEFMQCQNCPSQTCQVKDLYTKEHKIYKCPSCENGEVYVKMKNNDNVISCNKECGYEAIIPKKISKVEEIQENKTNYCKKCSKEGRGDTNKKSRLFIKGKNKFSKYMMTKLDKNNSGIFCLVPGCSEDLILLDYQLTQNDWEDKYLQNEQLKQKKQEIIEKFDQKNKKNSKKI